MKKRGKRIGLLCGTVLMLSAMTLPAYAQTPGRWISSGGQWWYRHNDATYTRNGWEQIGGKWYYFDAAGWMATGWVKDHNTWYYLKADGAMATGWVKDRNVWYYLKDSGAMATGWMRIQNKWYYFNKNGKMLTDWQQINGKWYYFADSGEMRANDWIGEYYVDQDGVWVREPGLSVQKDIGSMRIGYYCGVPINGGEVNLDDYELMQKIANYLSGLNRLDTSGKNIETSDGGSWYQIVTAYADGTTETASISEDGEYLWCEGVLYDVDLDVIKALWEEGNAGRYQYDRNGFLLTGWRKADGRWCYIVPETGKLYTGWKKSNGKWYFFNNDGWMVTGWKNISGKWYYFNESGAMMTGWIQVDGKSYYLDESGAMAVSTWIGNSYVDQNGQARSIE